MHASEGGAEVANDAVETDGPQLQVARRRYRGVPASRGALRAERRRQEQPPGRYRRVVGDRQRPHALGRFGPAAAGARPRLRGVLVSRRRLAGLGQTAERPVLAGSRLGSGCRALPVPRRAEHRADVGPAERR